MRDFFIQISPRLRKAPLPQWIRGEHWEKTLAPHTSATSDSEAAAIETEQFALGKRWTKKLEKVLPARRTFLQSTGEQGFNGGNNRCFFANFTRFSPQEPRKPVYENP
ncbi:MAG TPA: hypothetical protein VGE70_00075 [Burkholderiaceae bacterium]